MFVLVSLFRCWARWLTLMIISMGWLERNLEGWWAICVLYTRPVRQVVLLLRMAVHHGIRPGVFKPLSPAPSLTQPLPLVWLLNFVGQPNVRRTGSPSNLDYSQLRKIPNWYKLQFWWVACASKRTDVSCVQLNGACQIYIYIYFLNTCW